MKTFIGFVLLAAVVAALYVVPMYTCKPCEGQGRVAAKTQKVTCSSCSGKGTRKSMSAKKGVKSMGGNKMMCLQCKGVGHFIQNVSKGGTCLICQGKGKVAARTRIAEGTE